MDGKLLYKKGNLKKVREKSFLQQRIEEINYQRNITGELVIYVEIDSWVPIQLAPFLQKGIYAFILIYLYYGEVCITINFIGDKKFFNEIEGERIKTKKMRGQLSQGLVLDLKDSVILVIHKELN